MQFAEKGKINSFRVEKLAAPAPPKCWRDKMNLINGRLISRQQAEQIDIEKIVQTTLNKPPLASEAVIKACSRLADAVSERHIDVLTAFGIDEDEASQHITELKQFLSRDYLAEKSELSWGKPAPIPALCRWASFFI